MRVVVLIGLAALCLSSRAVADDMLDLPLEDLMKIRITTATKHSQEAREAPSSVTVITRKEIRRFGYRSLAEALRSVRGFYTSYDRNYGYVGVRGFLLPGDFSDRILLLVNGHTYNDDIYQQAFVDPTFGIDLEAIERIEVVRGPGSALYGGNALFAVINVVTSVGREQDGTQTRVETGSFGRKRGQASLGHVFESGLDVFASGSILDLDGQHELFYPEFDDPETHDGIVRHADGERALALFASARHGSFTLQGNASTRQKRVPTGAYDVAFGDPGTQTNDSRSFAELSYSSTDLAEGLEIAARVYYDYYRYHGTYIFGAGAERTKNEDLAESHWGGAELRSAWRPLDGHTLTTGAEVSYHPDAHQENFDLGGEHFLDDRRSFGTFGFYAQDEWTVLPSLTLVAGGRFDRYYSRFDEFSPRGALIWSPSTGTNMKVLYGRAFRAPNLYEQYYVGEAVGFLKSESLDRERISTYEVALDHAMPSNVSLSASVYHYEIENLIDQAVVANLDAEGTLAQFRNVKSTRATGGELEARASLPRGLESRAIYSYQDARGEGGPRLTNSPRHLGNVALLFPLPYGAQGGAELVVVGPRLTLARRTLDPVMLANLNLTSGTGLPNLEFGAGLYNLLNQRYAHPGGVEHRQDRIAQDRFTYRVQLSYRF